MVNLQFMERDTPASGGLALLSLLECSSAWGGQPKPDQGTREWKGKTKAPADPISELKFKSLARVVSFDHPLLICEQC